MGIKVRIGSGNRTGRFVKNPIPSGWNRGPKASSHIYASRHIKIRYAYVFDSVDRGGVIATDNQQ